MKIRALVLTLLLLPVHLAGLTSARADEPVTQPAQVAQRYHEVLTRPQFQETEEPSVSTRIEDALSQWFRRLGAKFGDFKYGNRIPAVESLLMALLVTFCIAVVLYIMMRLTRRRAKMEEKPDKKVPGPKTFQPPEFYDEEIHDAITAGNWHAAWLATWRQFLSRLENRHLVEADRTRTNREYLAQLRGQALPASALALLTGMVDAYDRFIYGRKAIAEPDWNHFHSQINEAGLLLHLEENSLATQPKRIAP
jgi:hypothetical protein